MRFSNMTINTFFILLLPLVVALFGLGAWTALLLILLGVVWRWVMTILALQDVRNQPPVVLETISASHYVEKVRWCLDRLGLPYEEVANVGVLGVCATGRTVPRLHVRTGSAISRIGNSPEILRYLWGAYGTEYGERAAFLKPTAEALELERRIDHYGVWLQQWLYRHILDDKELTLQLWGSNDASLPAWQTNGIAILFPLAREMLRYFMRTHPRGDRHPEQRIEGLLDEIEKRLGDGRKRLLGGEETTYVDITFAALSGLWVNPRQYGGGKADMARPDPADFPEPMTKRIAKWRDSYPLAVGFVENLYREERISVDTL